MPTELEGTPVAIAGLAVAGIIAIAYSPAEPETKTLAMGALGSLAGSAGGMAFPRQVARRRGDAREWLAESPARFPPEFGGGD